MAFISKRNKRREREIQRALNNRLELVKEGFTRRDLIKMGLMTSAGVLIAKGGLTHAQWGGHNGSSCYGNNCNVGCVSTLLLGPAISRDFRILGQ